MDASPGFQQTTVAIVGGGAVQRLGETLDRLGVSDPGILIDPGLVEGVVADAVRSSAPHGVLIPADAGEPTFASVSSAAERVRDSECDGLIAVGGGSTIDTAKLLRGLLATGTDDLAGVPEDAELQALPLIAIPTTAGTGAEMGSSAVVIDPRRDHKVLLTIPGLAPDVAIDDGHLTTTLPPSLTAYTGCDALAQAILAYSTAGHDAIGGQLALRAIELILEWLPRAVADGNDLRAREEMMLGSASSAIAMFNAPVRWDLEHAIAEPLGSMLGIHHGHLVAAFLPGVAEFNISALEDRYAELARHLGLAQPKDDDHAGALAMVTRLRAFVREVGVPALGLVAGDRDFDPLVEQILNAGQLKTNPVPMPADAIQAIIAGAWDGTFSYSLATAAPR